VIGCGNLLRGDDGVGPVLVRHLWERGVPDGAKLVDGGTAGMDVAFQMNGARRVVIIDAAATGLHTHSFRWDHAIAFARWALGDACPTDITVFLIEVDSVEMGADLSEPVATAMEEVLSIVERDYLAPLRPAGRREVTVEFTADGYLRLDAELAAARFPSDAVAAVVRDGALWLVPLRGPRSGGLLLKQRTPAGDRSVLVREVLMDLAMTGVRGASWDDDQSALRIPLGDEPGLDR